MFRVPETLNQVGHVDMTGLFMLSRAWGSVLHEFLWGLACRICRPKYRDLGFRVTEIM